MEEKRLSRTLSANEQQLAGGVCLNFTAFVEKYGSHYLPRAVQIRKGSIRTKQVDLSEGSIVTIYAVAKSDMVSIQDSKGMVYAIPLDATSEFGMIYEKYYSQSKQAIEFRTAGDLAASLPVPKIVGALKSWGEDPKSSIQCGEVLIVINASAKQLELYSITTMSEKTVPAKCAARFTTAPTSIKLPLSKLLHYFPYILPTKVVAFPDVYCSELPSELDLSEVTLLQRHEKGSAIASYHRQQDKVVFSFPATTQIDVYVMPFYDHKFIPPVYEYSGVKKKLESSNPESGFSASTLLSFPQGPQSYGSRRSFDETDTASTASVCADPKYDSPRRYSAQHDKKGVPLPESSSAITGYDSPRRYSAQHDKKGVPLPESSSAISGRGVLGDSSSKGNEYMNIDIPDSTDMAVRKANIEYLSSLDDTKVLKLLEKLDLSAYKKAFKKEKVNGYMMCRLDEETLENELGVKKHLHRIRLMELITGKLDARTYLAN